MILNLSVFQRLFTRFGNLFTRALIEVFTNFFKGRFEQRTRGLQGLFAFTLSALLGMGLAGAAATPYGMVDPIDPQQATGYHIYLAQCATCHVAIPPALLPPQTWQTLATDSAHYGLSLPPIPPFDQQLMLNYLQVYSRRHQGRGGLPYRLEDSAYFQALHPNVALPQPLNLRSCVGCHAGASEQNYTNATDIE